MICAFCQYNDGNVYTSIPAKYRCSIDNEFRVGDFECDKEFVPVRHGHWIGKPVGGYATVRCSVCDEVFLGNKGKWSYCPTCGAKMDE